MKIKAKKQDVMSVIVNFFIAFIMLGLPLIYDNGYHNITETKSRYYYIFAIFLVFAAGIFFIFEAVSEHRHTKVKIRFTKNFQPIDLSMLFFCFFVFLSSIFSKYQTDVWYGEVSRCQGAITVFLYVAVYFVISRNYKYSQSFLLCGIASFCIVSLLGVLNCFDIDILGIYSYLSSEYKRDFISTIGNINFYSSFMCLMLPLVLCGFCSTKKLISNIIYSVSLIVGAFGMTVTGSESFVIGFVFSVLVFPLFLMSDAERLKKFLIGIIIILVSAQIFKIIYDLAPVKNVTIAELLLFVLDPFVTVSIILVCSAVIFVLHKKAEYISKVKIIYLIAFFVIIFGIIILFILANVRGIGKFDKYFKITDSWGTLRGGIWKQCIEKFRSFSFKEKLFGIGPESAYHVLKIGGALSGKRLDQAHNEYLQILLTTGVFGLMSYTSIIVATVISVIRKLKDNILAVALLCALVAYWFQAIVNIEQPFTTPLMYVFISLVGAMCYNKTKETKITST